ncbi:Halocarboxylic acid dehydrogenase DehI [Modestobacter sp. DSM 44400]|uniref:halocarboxylic acid dehydrogenase DehI family protein n=1 Tax=Modestobacter sp. DSM 44400 TaxID=1550230 RepID=UPI00089AC7CB|nr:halocarboxylic acid dehydrogenase DehI family protein [Modestobacter sp. DSM 44400]SDX66143.1 Halocarboxylic acid dehydrogenase DehI [Modestobacter sp. DSM 44400]
MPARSTAAMFPQLDQETASGEIAELYADIRDTLRVPWVAFAIRVMAQFGSYVPQAWGALKPLVATQYAEDAADRIRRASILDGPPPPDPRPRLREQGWSEEDIAGVQLALDALNYGNPKYLILITAWNEAWHERAAGDPNHPLTSSAAAPLPYGLPDGVEPFHLVDPDAAPKEVQELLREARDVLLHHGPASDYRVLAAWPDLLRVAVEDVLRPVALTSEYEETTRRIREIAREEVAGLTGVGGVSRRDLEESMSPTDIAGLTGVLFMYNRFIADITVAIIRLQQAFDGGASAVENKFPA